MKKSLLTVMAGAFLAASILSGCNKEIRDGYMHYELQELIPSQVKYITADPSIPGITLLDDGVTLNIWGEKMASEATLYAEIFPAGIVSIDLSGLDISQVDKVWMRNMSELTYLKLKNPEDNSMENLNGAFDGCKKLAEMDLSEFDISNVTDMGSMLRDCPSLKTVKFPTSKANKLTDVNSMMSGCSSLEEIDLSSISAPKIGKMNFVLYNCTSLKKAKFFSGLNTGSLTSMRSCFQSCENLQEIDFNGMNTSNVTEMSEMFYKCTNIESLDLSSFNTEKVNNMSYMFYYCTLLSSLNLSSFNTANVTNMQNMFRKCEKLEILDISSFDTKKVSDMSSMFSESGFKTIYASDKFVVSEGANTQGMFYNDKDLVGAVAYAYGGKDGDYANYTTGYFTKKE